MRPIRYIGPFRSVSIETAPGRGRSVKRGETIEVSDRLADSLLEQHDRWIDPEDSDVPTGTVDVVLGWVNAAPRHRAPLALAAERAGKKRKALLEPLEQLVAGDAADVNGANGTQED